MALFGKNYFVMFITTATPDPIACTNEFNSTLEAPIRDIRTPDNRENQALITAMQKYEGDVFGPGIGYGIRLIRAYYGYRVEYDSDGSEVIWEAFDWERLARALLTGNTGDALYKAVEKGLVHNVNI
jgi:hypothetical protein